MPAEQHKRLWIRLDFAIAVLGALLTLAAGADLIKSNRATAATSSERFDRAVQAGIRYDSGGFVRGPLQPSHTLVVFSDFQCPFCKVYAGVLDGVHTRYPDVRIVERHWPLQTLHPLALTAALAAECARDVGRYSEMRSALFASQPTMAAGNWARLALRAGVQDTAAFARCVAERRHRDVVAQDAATAEAIGADGTPAIILDGLLLEPNPTPEMLDSLLRIRGPISGTK